MCFDIHILHTINIWYLCTLESALLAGDGDCFALFGARQHGITMHGFMQERGKKGGRGLIYHLSHSI